MVTGSGAGCITDAAVMEMYAVCYCSRIQSQVYNLPLSLCEQNLNGPVVYPQSHKLVDTVLKEKV